MEVVGLVVVDHPADKALAVVDRQAVVVVVAGQEVVVDPLVAVVGQVAVDRLVAVAGQVVVVVDPPWQWLARWWWTT